MTREESQFGLCWTADQLIGRSMRSISLVIKQGAGDLASYQRAYALLASVASPDSAALRQLQKNNEYQSNQETNFQV